MSARNLIDAIRPDPGPVMLPEASAWMQGRTFYGGASTLIAYTAAIRSFPDLPPLRAAQVGFVGPVGAMIEPRATVLREGRNVTQVRTELRCEGAIALVATFLFGAAREANAEYASPPCPDWPGPPEDAAAVPMNGAPGFTQNFEIRYAADPGGSDAPVVRRWLRLRDADGLTPIEQLILVGDALPPGSMRAMRRRGPLSSINWAFNILDPEPTTRDGWWLAETAGQWAADGFSSERLRLWNEKGRQLLDGLQSAAIFG